MTCAAYILIALCLPLVTVYSADDTECCFPTTVSGVSYLMEQRLFSFYKDFEQQYMVQRDNFEPGVDVYDFNTMERRQQMSGTCRIYDIAEEDQATFKQCIPKGAFKSSDSGIGQTRYSYTAASTAIAVTVKQKGDLCVPLQSKMNRIGHSIAVTVIYDAQKKTLADRAKYNEINAIVRDHCNLGK